MSVPSFDEFIASLDPDCIGQEIDRLCPMHILEGAELSPQQTAALEIVHREALKSSVRVSLLYLQKYHEWLTQQIP